MPAKGHQSGRYVQCPICGVMTYRYPSVIHRKCCSKKCANQLIAQMYTDNEDRANILREARKLRDYSDPSLSAKLSTSVKRAWRDGRIKPRLGKDNNLWKGGVSTPQNRLRHSARYLEWRNAVYARDGNACVKCGSTEDLHAHHVKSFAEYPELRHDVDNGITVCRTHHGELHGRPLPDIANAHKSKKKENI